MFSRRRNARNQENSIRVVALLSSLLLMTVARADVIRLNNGGELRGSIQSQNNERLVIETIKGTTVAVSRAQVAFVVPRKPVEEEYETRLASVPSTADAHWELGEWCRANRLRPQRTAQLKQVLLRDPHHKKARRLLGYSQQDDGSWVTRDQIFWKQGMVKNGRRFVTRQERDSIAKSQADRDVEATWSRKVNRLSDLFARGDASTLAELGSIRDPLAIASLSAFFRSSSSEAARVAYVGTLGRIPHPSAIPPLVDQAVFDVSPRVREAAVSAIPPAAAKEATQLAAEYLEHHDNYVVSRAATAIGRLQHPDGVESLLGALITLHEYSARVSTAPVAQERVVDLIGKDDLSPDEIILVLQAGLIPRRAANATTEDSNGLVQIWYPHRNRSAIEALSNVHEAKPLPAKALLQLSRAIAALKDSRP